MTIMDDAGRLETLRQLMERTGYSFVEPPILMPTELLVDLVGEDIRRRLYVTGIVDGDELCLRPDFTIPICRLHSQGGDPARPAGYAYLGPVFRQRSGRSGEFIQAGIESIGKTDREATDAEMLSLALSCLSTFDISDPIIHIGDQALFEGLLDGLDLPAAWKRRLLAATGDRGRLDRLIAGLAGDDPSIDGNGRAGLLAALEGADHDAALGLVEDLLSIAGISVVGGRSASEIAERFLEQATFTASAGARPDIAEILHAFLGICGPPDEAIERIDHLCAHAGIDLNAQLDRLHRRATLMAERRISFERMVFAADFGRRLDYYTGFVFELEDAQSGSDGPIIGGGRYDRLLAALGAEGEVPAVGFSIWLERLQRRGGQ